MFDPYEQQDLNTSASAAPHLSKLIDGKYMIRKLIGAGSSSRVYSASIFPGDAQVAIKILRESCSTADGERKLALEGSVLIEAGKHKNFVSVHDFGKTEAGEPYLVTELVRASNLRTILKDYKSLPLDRAIDIGLELVDALEHLHSLGIFHTSFKPADILLTDNPDKIIPEVKLVDLDSIYHPEEPDLYNSELPAEGSSYHYLSIEQILEQPVDARADIYVFSIILFEMITGRLPFDGSDAIALLNNKISSTIVPFPVSAQAQAQASSMSLETLIRKCLQADKYKRVQSLSELRDQLISIRQTIPDTKAHAVDEKNWDKLDRASYASKDSELNQWLGKLKKFITG